jgi:DnaJ-class molecular chaperone
MKIYPIVCPSCIGTGAIAPFGSATSNAEGRKCPACDGSGVVSCSDTNNEQIKPLTQEEERDEK